jgi:MSHA pilin protein MshC
MPRQHVRSAAVRPQLGYTLIELAVVITILGVLSASIGPRFFTQSAFSERGYADELASALRATQKAAVITGCRARLTLTASAYSATQQAAAGNTCLTSDNTWPTAVLGAGGDAIANTAPSAINAAPAGVYEFDSQGRLIASPGTSITIGARQITIEANTGFVQVQ